MAKKRGTSASKKAYSMPLSEKIGIVIKNFIVFFTLFIASFILYRLSSVGFWNDLFFLLILVFGFLSLALLIVWMILKLMQVKK